MLHDDSREHAGLYQRHLNGVDECNVHGNGDSAKGRGFHGSHLLYLQLYKIVARDGLIPVMNSFPNLHGSF
jgi:hypothetical protein